MHIPLVSVVVDDYDDAIEFYVGLLGFELVEDTPAETNDGRPKRWVVVRPAGATTGLLLARADSDRQRAAIGNQTGGRVAFFLHADDFDTMFNRLQSAGVEFCSPPRSEPYGQVAAFIDLVGNKWDLLGPGPELKARLWR